MKQITEDYCSLETSKLLKEKWFDVPTMYFFSADGTKRKFQQAHRLEDIAQPTHQMALKWLREVHNWYIDIRFNRYYQYYIPIVYNMSGTLESIANLEERPKQYEQAVEAALLYVLKNLI